MARLEQKNYQRYDDLLEHFGGYIRRYCLDYARSEDEARALMQEVLVTLWESVVTLRARIPSPMANLWLQRVMHSAVANYRRCNPDPMVIPLEAADTLPFAEDSGSIAAEAIADLAMHLSPEERELLDDYLGGYSFNEIAAARGMALGALRVRMHRIKKKLKTINTKLYGK